MQTCGFYSFFPGVMGPSLSGSGGIFTLSRKTAH